MSNSPRQSKPGAARDALGAGVVVAATLVAYLPAFSAGFIWDDNRYVTENQALLTLDGLRRIWFELGATIQYYPLVFSTFWIEQHLWGLAPAGYHVVNILLHAASAILVWRILRRLTVPGAWLAGAVFALHPIQVESVAWVTERKNVLSGLFYLLALWSYLQHDDLSEAPRPSRRHYYALALLFLLFALFSKTTTCTLPAVILLLVWWKRGRLARRDLLAVAPMFLLSSVLAYLTVWMEKHHVLAQGEAWSMTILQRFLLAGRVICFYAAKLLWPQRLTFIYERWNIDPRDLLAWMWPAIVIAVIASLWSQRRRIGRGPLTAVLFFGGTLTPALGFINVYPFRFSFVADHFQYLAGIGIIALVCAAMTQLATEFKSPLAPRLAALPLVVLLAALSFRQSRIYRDPVTLWEDTIAKNDRAWIAHNNLALEFNHTARSSQAIDHFRAAIRLKPDCVEARNNLGNALLRLDRIDEAIAEFRAALPFSSRFPGTNYNLAVALGKAGLADQQLEQFREAVRLNSSFWEARLALAVTLAERKNWPEAAAEYEICLRQWPNDARLHYEFAAILQRLGKHDAAASHYRQAARLDPAFNKPPPNPQSLNPSIP